MNRIRMRLQSDEKGQALVVLALFFFLVFLVFAALAVDGTIIYLRRRQLQNMADASALAAAEYLGKDKNEAAAYQEAMDSIAENGGRIDWYSTLATANPISTNVGSGVNLIKGIEISDACDVRVALQWSDMGTYFTQFFGRQTLQVGANAHAACNRAGGLVPIAIKRFGDERDWNMDLHNINQAKVYCDECDTRKPLKDPPPGQGKKNATEFLRPESSVWDYQDTITLWPPGHMMYKPPNDHADKSNGKPGREFWVLGNGVVPNRGTIAYAGLVNLDIRHVSSPPMEYYNGVSPSTQSNTLKDLGEHYIRKGYCCDIPAPGDEVAMYNGTSAAFSPQALRQTYREGDVIAVIVYNGHVFNTPDLIVTGDDPNYKATYPTTNTITSDVLTYSIHLEADGFQSSPAGLTMNVEGLDGFAAWAFSPTSSPVVGRDGTNERWLTLTVTPTLTDTTVGTTTVTHVVTGTRTFYVSAIDNKVAGTDLHRYWVGFATVGDTISDPISGTIQRDAPAVTCAPTNAEGNGPFIATVKGQQAKYELELDLWGVTGDREVTVSASSTPAGNLEWVNSPPWNRGANPDKHPGGKLRMSLKTPDNVITNTIHTIPLTVSAAGIPEPQTCNLYVLVEEAGSVVKDYVEILGYAALEIDGYYNNEHPVVPGQNPNAVRGRVVGELMSSPPDLTYGLRARLIPWDF